MKKITTTLFALLISVFAFAAGHTVSVTTTNVLCSGACNGTATATVSGGIGPFAYDWAPATPPGDGTPFLTNLCGGSYTLIVTDSSDMSTSTASFIITDPTPLTVSISGGGGAICSGTCTSLNALGAGGTPPYTFSWTPSGSMMPSYSACPLAGGGTYTVTLTDSHGCVASGTTSLSVYSPPNLTLNITNTTCATSSGSVAISGISGGVSPYTFAFNGGPYTAMLLYSGLAVGTYPMVIKDATGCTGYDTATIINGSSATVTVPANITVCNGSVVPLGIFSSTPAGATFVWTNSNTAIGFPVSGVGSIPSFTAINTGTIPVTSTITVTPTIGCSGTPNTYTITVNPADDASFSYTSTSYCQAGTDPLPLITGVSPGVFSVTPPTLLFVTTTTGEIDLAASSLGTYTITYTTGALCPNSSSTSVTINSVDDASFNYSSSIYCQSGINPTPTITGTTGGIFSGPPGFVINPSTGLVNLMANSLGTQIITYTTSGACADTSNFMFTIDGPLITLPPSSTVCSGSCATLSPTIFAGTPTYTFSWSPATSLSSSVISNPVSCPVVTTIYTVNVIDSHGCSASATTTVYVDGPITSNITSTNTTGCTTADGTASVAPTGGLAPYMYLWNSFPAQTTATAVSQAAGTYSVTITDINGCTATDSTTIFANNDVAVNFTMVPDSTNPYNFFAFNSSTGTGNVYQWEFGDGATSTLANPSHTYTPTGTYNVCLTASSFLCGADTLCQAITVTGVPASCLALFNIADDTLNPDPNAHYVYNLSYGATLSYLWDFGDGATSTSMTPFHVYAGTGPYLLCLSVDNGAGCIDMFCDSLISADSLNRSSGTMQFVVYNVPPFQSSTVGIANQNNSFSVSASPNPFNDVTTFEIQSTKNEAYSFELTDVLGKKVKSMTGISDKQFQISRSGLENGIYFYKIYNAESIVGIGKLIIK